MLTSLLRRTGWTLLTLLSLLLLVLLAWVLSNLKDNPAQPRPAALALPASPTGSPMFFRMQGVLAPAGSNAEDAGRQAWQALHAVPAGPAASAPAGSLATISGLPLQCRAPTDCVPQLATSVPAVAAQLQPHALLGERCAELASDLRFEEAFPPRMGPDTPLPAYQGLVQCELWLKGQALIAAAAGDQPRALGHLQTGNGLARAVLTGSPMLIGRMVGAAMARSHYDAVLAVATLQPSWTTELAPLVAPLPAPALDARPWMVMESAWHRGAIDDLVDRCGKPGAGSVFGQEGVVGLARLGDLACQLRIGFLPEATRQAMDQPWLARVAEASQGLDAAMDASIARAKAPPPEVSMFVWRNPVGHLLVQVAQPDLGPYVARVADTELQRQALALALAASAVPAAEREAWLARQDLPARQRARLGWADGGRRLTVRPWLGELPGSDARREPYALAVPGA